VQGQGGACRAIHWVPETVAAKTVGSNPSLCRAADSKKLPLVSKRNCEAKKNFYYKPERSTNYEVLKINRLRYESTTYMKKQVPTTVLFRSFKSEWRE
jgi:hypothetical protein